MNIGESAALSPFTEMFLLIKAACFKSDQVTKLFINKQQNNFV